MVANQNQSVAHQVLKIHGNRLSITKILHEVKMKHIIVLCHTTIPLCICQQLFPQSSPPLKNPKTGYNLSLYPPTLLFWVFRKIFIESQSGLKNILQPVCFRFIISYRQSYYLEYLELNSIVFVMLHCYAVMNKCVLNLLVKTLLEFQIRIPKKFNITVGQYCLTSISVLEIYRKYLFCLSTLDNIQSSYDRPFLYRSI